MDLIVTEGMLVSASPLPLELPDPDDVCSLEVAEAAEADALVTASHRTSDPSAEARPCVC